MKKLGIILATGLLALVGCKQAKFATAEDINGFNPGAANNAIFGQGETLNVDIIDTDTDGDGIADAGDGIADFDVEVFIVLASDDAAICDTLAVNIDADEANDIDLEDETVAQILVLRLGAAGTAAGFAAGDELVGNLDAGLQVSGAFFVEQGNVEQVNASDDGEGTLTINDLGDTFAGAFETTLTTDFSQNEQGDPIDVAMTGDIKAAQACAAGDDLGQLFSDLIAALIAGAI